VGSRKRFGSIGGYDGNASAVAIQSNEEKLIRAGQRGDEQAVEALFRRYQRRCFRRPCGCWERGGRGRRTAGRLLSAYRNLRRFEGGRSFRHG